MPSSTTTLQPECIEALKRCCDNGAVFVTPNKRLARHLAGLLEQLAQPAAAFECPEVLPLEAWSAALWHRALLIGQVEPLYLLSDFQDLQYWRQVIENSDTGAGLIATSSAARLAQQAFRAMHEHQIDAEANRFEFQSGIDSAAFFHWQQAYCDLLARKGQLSLVQAQQNLLKAAEWPRTAPTVAVGFDVLPPLQSALLARANAAFDTSVGELQLHVASQVLLQCHCHDEEDELYQAAQWASAMQRSHPEQTVAVVIRDLAARQEQVERIFHSVCQPAVLRLDRQPAFRHVNVSASRPIDALPMVRTVLNLTQSALQPLDLARWRELLYSPYLAFHSEVPGLANTLVKTLYAAGEESYRLAELPSVLRWAEGDSDDSPQRQSLEKSAQAAARLQRSGGRARALPSHWLEQFTQLWDQLGWLENTRLGSVEYQQQRRFEQALVEFGGLDLVVGEVTAHRALSLLREHCASYAFHTETLASPELPNPINVLGQLEASGLHFDFIWLVGMSSRQWPSPARPLALLPTRLQREAGLPASSQPLAFAQAQLRGRAFLNSATTVVASFPGQIDDIACEFSTLLASLAHEQGLAIDTLPRQQRVNEDVAAVALEERADWRGMPIDTDAIDGAVRGGASLLGMHAANPLLAYLQWRLGIEALAQPVTGISPLERGTLVHQVLEGCWREIRDQAKLQALTEQQLRACIEEQVDRNLATLFRRRYRAPAGALLTLERERLVNILAHWFALEQQRPAFAVEQLEQTVTLTLAGLTISLRIDRIDRLDGDKQLLLDYKTGKQTLPSLFASPPSPLQLPLYCLALEQLGQFDAERIAIAYAILRPDELGLLGTSSDAHPAQQLAGMRGEQFWQKYAFEQWADVIEAWRTSITEQLEQIREADIRLDPERHGNGERAAGAIDRLAWSTCALAEDGGQEW